MQEAQRRLAELGKGVRRKRCQNLSFSSDDRRHAEMVPDTLSPAGRLMSQTPFPARELAA
jgi:hypothetical protein